MNLGMSDRLGVENVAKSMLYENTSPPVEIEKSKKTRKVIMQTTCIALLAIGFIVGAVLLAETGISIPGGDLGPEASSLCGFLGLVALVSTPMPWLFARATTQEKNNAKDLKAAVRIIQLEICSDRVRIEIW